MSDISLDVVERRLLRLSEAVEKRCGYRATGGKKWIEGEMSWNTEWQKGKKFRSTIVTHSELVDPQRTEFPPEELVRRICLEFEEEA